MDTTTLVLIILAVFIIGYILGRKTFSPTTFQPPSGYIPPKKSVATGIRMSKAELQAEIKDLLKHEQKIQAIKLLCEQRGLGLKQSKDYVDAFEQGLQSPLDLGD